MMDLVEFDRRWAEVFGPRPAVQAAPKPTPPRHSVVRQAVAPIAPMPPIRQPEWRSQHPSKKPSGLISGNTLRICESMGAPDRQRKPRVEREATRRARESLHRTHVLHL